MLSRVIHLVIVFSILACPTVAIGQATTETEQELQQKTTWSKKQTEDLTRFLESIHENKELSGTVLIADDGKTVFEHSFGWAEIGKRRQLGPDSSFRLASVSKQFTAMGIMLLAEQGKLSLDDDIRKHLPKLPYEGITIRHLLHHTGGLTDYMSLFAKHWDSDAPIGKRKLAFNRDLVALFAEKKPEIDFEPGERNVYSNTGYVLLGHIIEVASGQPVQDFFQTSVFEPLGMKDSCAFSADDRFKLTDRVHGFQYLKGSRGHRDVDSNFLNGMVGDGGIYCSARDLLKWSEAIRKNKLVSPDMMRKAFASGKTNEGKETGYGFGWSVRYDEAGELLSASHDGSWVGFRTSIKLDFVTGRTVIVLTNSNSTSGFDKAMTAVFRVCQGEPAIQEKRRAIDVSPEKLKDFAGKYELQTAGKLEILIEDGQLFGQPAGQGKRKLTCVGEDEFEAQEVKANLSFERDESGKVTGFVFRQSGREITAKRLKK